MGKQAIMNTTTYTTTLENIKEVLTTNGINLNIAHYVLTRNYQESRKAIPEEVREQMKLDKKEAAKQVKLLKAKERAEKLAQKAKDAALKLQEIA
jgi:hypothetical protein